MAEKSRWETREIKCPEEKRKAKLLVEYRLEEGKEVLNSIICDNPKLADLDNWDCKWSCWKKLSKKKKT